MRGCTYNYHLSKIFEASRIQSSVYCNTNLLGKLENAETGIPNNQTARSGQVLFSHRAEPQKSRPRSTDLPQERHANHNRERTVTQFKVLELPGISLAPRGSIYTLKQNSCPLFSSTVELKLTEKLGACDRRVGECRSTELDDPGLSVLCLAWNSNTPLSAAVSSLCIATSRSLRLIPISPMRRAESFCSHQCPSSYRVNTPQVFTYLDFFLSQTKSALKWRIRPQNSNSPCGLQRFFSFQDTTHSTYFDQSLKTARSIFFRFFLFTSSLFFFLFVRFFSFHFTSSMPP